MGRKSNRSIVSSEYIQHDNILTLLKKKYDLRDERLGHLKDKQKAGEKMYKCSMKMTEIDRQVEEIASRIE